MPSISDPPVLPTVSRALLEDWLTSLRTHCDPRQLKDFLNQTRLSAAVQPRARVTHDQIVKLYQLVAIGTGDEMMGLWSRPIRTGALKHLCASVRGASSLSAALFRFTTFWNLLLDDYSLDFRTDADQMQLILVPRNDATPQRFGHMLLIKLAHGIASWLAGHELPLRRVSFVFARPEFAEDYPVLFPAPVHFGQPASAITFDAKLGNLAASRSESEMQDFLVRAPRDWIFTNLREHALPLRVRELILLSDRLDCSLTNAAGMLGMTPRTLMRRLDSDATSFQAIKNGLRRDIAIRDLMSGSKSIEAIAQDIGFASPANFHRAFKHWVGATPGAYRRSGA